MTPQEKIAEIIGEAIESYHTGEHVKHALAQIIIDTIREPTMYMLVKLGDEPYNVQDAWGKMLDTLDAAHELNEVPE